MSLTYSTWQAQLANLMATATTDPGFQVMSPGAIDYAEQRLYRDLDLINTIVRDATGVLAPNQRGFTLPTDVGTYIVVNNVNIFTPAASGNTGTRVPLTPVSQAAIDMMWPSGALNTGQPQVYCRLNGTTLLMGPSPDAAYAVEVIGTQRPVPLSADNSSTILTQYVPDLFLAASMIFASGYMRNFGAQADDPRMAASWEGQYQSLLKSAEVEQLRARFASQGWTSQTPSPLASPRT